MYLRLSYIFLNIFIFTCSCCYRSIKPIVDVQNEEKITKEISRSLKQSSEACFENETLKLYCYNNGKCLIKRVPFNITHQTVVLYCECKQGFGGVNCREDNRFLLADVNILFATFVCLVVSATIIYLVYRYKCGDLKEKYGNEAREKFLKNGRSDYNRQNSEHFSKLFSRTDEVRKSSVQWQNKHISVNQGADNNADTDSK